MSQESEKKQKEAKMDSGAGAGGDGDDVFLHPAAAAKAAKAAKVAKAATSTAAVAAGDPGDGGDDVRAAEEASPPAAGAPRHPFPVAQKDLDVDLDLDLPLDSAGFATSPTKRELLLERAQAVLRKRQHDEEEVGGRGETPSSGPFHARWRKKNHGLIVWCDFFFCLLVCSSIWSSPA